LPSPGIPFRRPMG